MEQPSLRDWIEQYNLAVREHRCRITPPSSLVGKRLDDLPLRAIAWMCLPLSVLAGTGTEMIRPSTATELQAGDILLMDFLAPRAEIDAIQERYSVEELPLDADSTYFTDRSQELSMAELILPANSVLIGETVLEARVRTEFGLSVIGLRRGQAVLVIGFWTDIRRAQRDAKGFIVLNMPAELDEVLPAASKAPQAVGVLALVVALMVSGLVPNVQAALIGCLLMGLFGCVRYEQRLSLDKLEDSRPYRRYAAFRRGAGAHGRRRSRRQ